MTDEDHAEEGYSGPIAGNTNYTSTVGGCSQITLMSVGSSAAAVRTLSGRTEIKEGRPECNVLTLCCSVEAFFVPLLRTGTAAAESFLQPRLYGVPVL